MDQLRRQQPAVLEQLAVVFTRGGAIERSLLDTMVQIVASAASLASQQKMVQEAHMRTFFEHKATYIQYAAARAKLRQEQSGARLFPGLAQQPSPPPTDFGEYGDKDGYRGWIPLTSWISGEFCLVSLAALDASRLCGRPIGLFSSKMHLRGGLYPCPSYAMMLPVRILFPFCVICKCIWRRRQGESFLHNKGQALA